MSFDSTVVGWWSNDSSRLTKDGTMKIKYCFFFCFACFFFFFWRYAIRLSTITRCNCGWTLFPTHKLVHSTYPTLKQLNMIWLVYCVTELVVCLLLLLYFVCFFFFAGWIVSLEFCLLCVFIVLLFVAFFTFSLLLLCECVI